MSSEVVQVSGPAPAGGFAVPGTEQVIDATFGAARVSIRPDEYQFNGRIMGHYSQSISIGGQAWSATPTIVLAWRWLDASALQIIKRVRAYGVVTTAGTGSLELDMTVARGYTVAETTNVAALSTPPVNDSGKMRQSMGPSIMGSLAGGTIHTANAAAGMSGGTRTLDANPIGMAGLGISPLAADVGRGSVPVNLYEQLLTSHPLALRQNEGFLVRVPAALTTTVLALRVVVDWFEAAAY